MNVLTKLDIIIANQQEQLSLLRQCVASTPGPEAFDNLLPKRLVTVDQLNDLSDRLRDGEFQKKMVNLVNEKVGGFNDCLVKFHPIFVEQVA